MPITEILRPDAGDSRDCQWALFLRNHDELTLEMVTDEERDYMYRVYAADPQMRLNVGIRRRLAPLLDNNRRRIELLNALLFSLPGHADRLLRRRDRDGRQHLSRRSQRRAHADAVERRPQRAASRARIRRGSIAPPIMDPVYGYQAINVEAQQRYPFSLLNWMKRLIALRKQHRVFGRGVTRVRRVPEPQGARVSPSRRPRNDARRRAISSRSVQPAALDLSRVRRTDPGRDGRD